MLKKSISRSAIRRLPRYYRFLGELLSEGTEKISSRELAERMRVTASQIRQDLNCFGGFGQQGYGYNVAELRTEIAAILGLDKHNKTILVGAGNLGRALIQHIDYEKYGCRLCGVFDRNERIIGTVLAGHRILDVSSLPEFCHREQPKAAILCIPKNEAHKICETLISQGVIAFWNFSHYDINLDFDDIIVENVHLGDSLMALSFGINNRESSDNKNSD